MEAIRFGTDGWRAIIADQFTLANVRIVAQGIADYLKEHSLADKGVFIGYDNRFMSERFAAEVAGVMAGNGVGCRLPGEAVPTPVTAHAIKQLAAGGAVMVTASHNPPEYNGIKFIPNYAGPATPEITGEIERRLAAISPDQVKWLSLDQGKEKGLVLPYDPKPAYLKHLNFLLDYNARYESKMKIVVDPMWGAGSGYVAPLLAEKCSELKLIHNYRDPLFGGSLPEPTAERLVSLKETVLQEGADLGLALDGDADRFGVIDNEGVYVSPNEVLYLLFYYILEYRRWRGAVARTVATTHMLDRIADDYGLPVVETPVGFKYIGQSLIKHRSILGGEESGGMSVQGHIPEKDGLLALDLIVEMLAERELPLRRLQEEIFAKFGRLVSRRFDCRFDPGERETLLQHLQEWSPQQLGGNRVEERKTIDGIKLILEDGSWVLVRPSGTEPLFRVYVEAANEERLQQLGALSRQALGLSAG